MSEARKCGILSLGTRKDATSWQKGCAGLGFDVVKPIKKPKPSLAELQTFFESKPAWIYFGGHFSSATLFNDKYTVKVEFRTDDVSVTADGTNRLLSKTKHEFRLHENCRVVLWGGCSVCSGRKTIETLRVLFGGSHAILGFAGSTGWRMVDAMLGGGFMKKGHFFERVKENPDDLDHVVQSWMKAAWKGYGGGDNADLFRAVDAKGQEWKLGDKGIVKGRKFS